MIIVPCIIVFLFICVWAYHRYAIWRDRKRYPASGIFADTPGGRMHLVKSGTGPVIVVLPGWNCGLPSVEFLPLTTLLSGRFTVVTAEPLGYGCSDIPNRPRTMENMLEELRAGIRGMGLTPPYCLAGHSIAGCMMTYYAHRYPDEVRAIVHIDAPAPLFYQTHREPGDEKFAVLGMLARMGILRLLTALPKARQKAAIPMDGFRAYTAEQRRLLRAFSAATMFNPGALDEYSRIRENSAAAGGIVPESVKVLLFISSQFLAYCKDEMPKEEQDFIDQNHADARVVEGGHYLHVSHAERLAAEIEAFLA